jgi:hypothetical protein
MDREVTYLQVWHPVLTFFTDFLVLGGLGGGPDRWANTLLLREGEESPSADEADKDLGCIFLHHSVAIASETSGKVAHGKEGR